MKNREIVTNYNNIYGIINRNEKYPVKLSYALSRNLKILEPLAKEFEDEKNKLLEKHGIKNLDGTFQRNAAGEYDIVTGHEQEWEQEITELLEIEVKVEPHMVSVADYPENIEPAIILVLDFMTENEG